LAQLLAAGTRAEVVIAAARDGGTNALLLSPPDAIAFRFGPGSAARHEAAARASGKSVERLLLPHLSRDLDRPEDLAEAVRRPLDAASVYAFAPAGIGEIEAGADLARIVATAAEAQGTRIAPGDIVVVAQKIVSKSEGRMVPLAAFTPSDESLRLGREIGKDPRKVEAILRESESVVRAERRAPEGLLITRHRQGWICANAGIDESNLGGAHEGMLLLLPEDADASARRIRAGLEARCGGPIGVIVSDTFGRPWRNGLVNVAIGVAGVPVLVDWTGRTDAYGRGLKATIPAFADEVAAAAGLLMGKDAGRPAVVLRGLEWQDDPDAGARQVLRPIEQELFL
jgi:coenzyme F420-0:L-glutamate ligase/coenzyme F420-1:gamma-L-glutamate ligase